MVVVAQRTYELAPMVGADRADAVAALQACEMSIAYLGLGAVGERFSEESLEFYGQAFVALTNECWEEAPIDYPSITSFLLAFDELLMSKLH